MKSSKNMSAGLMLYRRTGGRLEVLLGHPGGPFWADKDLGAWSIPKGLVAPGEDTLAAARREFREETGFSPAGPFLPLGSIKQKAGKVVHAWACKGDLDPASAKSNLMSVVGPPGSGRLIQFPEVDRCEWFTPEEAREKVNAAQMAFIYRLEAALS